MTATPVDAMATQEKEPGSLWRHRDFLLLWGGQTVSDVGSNLTQLALPLVALLTLKATTFEVGVLTAASTLAFLLVALPAGPIVERMAKRRLMIWCDIGRVLVLGSVPVAAVLGVLTMVQLYVVALVAGVLTVFFSIAYQSYLPVMLDKDQLVDGNGKLGTSQSFAQLIGPSLGGLMVSLMGAAKAVAVDALSFAVSAGSLALIRHPDPKPEAPSQKRNLRAEIAEGLRFVFGHPILRKIVATTAVGNFFGTIVLALLMVFLVNVLHAEPWVIGLVLAGSSIGGLVGGLIAGWVGKRIGTARMIWLPALLLNWCGLLVPLARPGWSIVLVAIGSTVLTALGVLYNSAQVSYRQRICPPELLSRMNASVRWIIWGTMPLGALVGGALGEWIGVRPALVIAALGDWFGILFVVFSPLRKMRDVPDQ